MKTRMAAIFLGMALASGCSRAPRAESKEAVQQALMQYWNTRQGLAVDKMDIEILQIKFSGDTAQAEVSFHAKGSQAPSMNMSYTLRRRGDRWRVNQRTSGGFNPHVMGGSGNLPPGHPPLAEPSPATRSNASGRARTDSPAPAQPIP